MEEIGFFERMRREWSAQKWNEIPDFVEIRGNSFKTTDSPTAIMKQSLDSILSNCLPGQMALLKGTRVVIDTIRALPIQLDFRLISSTRRHRPIWFRWEMRSNLQENHYESVYKISGALAREHWYSNAEWELVSAIIDVLDFALRKNGFELDVWAGYLSGGGWNCTLPPTAPLTNTVTFTVARLSGNTFLAGGFHGSYFLSSLASELSRQNCRTVQLLERAVRCPHISVVRPLPGEGFLRLVIHYSSLNPNTTSNQTDSRVLKFRMTVKPGLSTPSDLPLLQITYDLSIDFSSFEVRNSEPWHVVESLVDEIEKLMLAAGAVICGSQKNIRKSIDDCLKATWYNIPPNSAVSPTAASPEWLDTASENRPTPSKDKRGRGRWPSAQDFCEAIQSPRVCFSDEELRRSSVDTNHLGLPRVASGAFASVYRLSSSKGDWAVRCFNSRVKDQAERYACISRFICSDNLPYTVWFQYLENGIRVNGEWYPILKMDWVEGSPLNHFVDANVTDSDKLESTRGKFQRMLMDLQTEHVAHGDLQHGNIIIRDDEFVLVDYDGMFVPALRGFPSLEKGHPNYQHPRRGAEDFNQSLDNFSAWLIDSALLSLREDPELWTNFGAGDESLLFRRSDLLEPQRSPLFIALLTHSSSDIRDRANLLIEFLNGSLDSIAPFGSSHSKSGSSGLPDWMSETPFF